MREIYLLHCLLLTCIHSPIDLKSDLSHSVHKRIGQKRALPNNILRQKVNWIGHDAIEAQMTEVKGVGKIITDP